MSGSKPHRYRPPRVPNPRAKSVEDVPELSAEEVERRVDVRGGGTPPPAPVDRPIRDRRPPRKKDRTVARDSLLVLALVIVGLVAVRLLLPDGPLTASASDAPAATQVAFNTGAPATRAPVGTPNLLTLPPSPTESAAPLVPLASDAPTAIPGPTPTVRPGATPTPTKTPSPTKTPTPTSVPTPAATARLTVKVIPITDDGGTAVPGSWTITVNSAGTASPSSFTGRSAGTAVTISANKAYDVTFVGPGGYDVDTDPDCSSATGGLPIAGGVETCTLTFDDRQAQVTVSTIVDGGTQSPSDWTVTVTGTSVSPSSFAGSSSGTVVHLDSHASFSVDQTNASGGADYTAGHSGTCSSSGLATGAVVSCTFTFTYVPPPTEPPPAPAAPVAWIVPAVGIAGLGGRRWWTTIRRR